MNKNDNAVFDEDGLPDKLPKVDAWLAEIFDSRMTDFEFRVLLASKALYEANGGLGEAEWDRMAVLMGVDRKGIDNAVRAMESLGMFQTVTDDSFN